MLNNSLDYHVALSQGAKSEGKKKIFLRFAFSSDQPFSDFLLKSKPWSSVFVYFLKKS